MPAEAARDPQARLDLADLRHAMHGVAERAAPGIFEIDLAELRENPRDVAPQPLGIFLGAGFTHRHAAGPDQPVAGEPVMVVGDCVSLTEPLNAIASLAAAPSGAVAAT